MMPSQISGSARPAWVSLTLCALSASASKRFSRSEAAVWYLITSHSCCSSVTASSTLAAWAAQGSVPTSTDSAVTASTPIRRRREGVAVE